MPHRAATPASFSLGLSVNQRSWGKALASRAHEMTQFASPILIVHNGLLSRCFCCCEY